MRKGKRKMLPGVSRARRPKTGQNKGLLILLNQQEKMQIESAAASAGVSMSRFIVETALAGASRILAKTPAGKPGKTRS
jgi:uncharacterized protein (DUF1778 family)